MPPAPMRLVVRGGNPPGVTGKTGAALALGRGMEISEGTRLEKALVVAACFPFLMLGLLFLFA
ncbi:MAG TPA: hypothetical protein VFH98_07145 [Candidatus Limnocylindria bacterium]|jgi:hypothetical protein|nr:hypothetical protein [Candidatus Limnocylindria bacterium]